MITKDEVVELKPCPFCGGEAIERADDPTMYCRDCEAQGPMVSFGRPKSLAENWNTRSEPPLTEGWQDIETAPKDGTTVLVWSNGVHFGNCFDGWTWTNPNKVYEYSDGDCVDMAFEPQPTHWMHLPAPPSLR